MQMLIEAAGASLRFLPPYSPDFNQIEKAFSRLKAMLRKAGERPIGGLRDLIGRLVDLFKPTECANYFSSCRYDDWRPDRLAYPGSSLRQAVRRRAARLRSPRAANGPGRCTDHARVGTRMRTPAPQGVVTPVADEGARHVR